jgi:hypothetical protein
MESQPRVPRVRAALVALGCFAVFIGALIVGSRTPDLASVASSAPSRDIDMYAAIVSRIRAGEHYHSAVGRELRARHYPTIPVFNWRTPLLYSTLARIPDVAGRVVLVSLALSLLAASLAVLGGRPPTTVIAGLFLQIGAAISFLVPEAVVMSEAWAGVLVGLSMCAYIKGAHRTGASLGLLALFIRELVAPYAVLSGILALRRRRKHEVLIWVLGTVAYAVYYGWHFVTVSALHQPGDFAHQSSWLYGGGLPFVLNTLRMNALLLVAPGWVLAVVLALLVAAVTGPSTNVRLRCAVAIYLGFFVVAGQPFNYYWGLITVALWPLVVPDGITSLRKAVSTVRERSAGVGTFVSTRARQ